jgi:hypothetical protein
MADTVYSEPEYADPACTTPVLSWADPKREAPYLATDLGAADQAAACGADLATLASVSRGTPVAAWHIGAEQPAPPALYFRNGGGCTRRLDMPPAIVHSVEKVAPSELVALTAIHVEPRGASLAVQVFDNEDGSSTTGDVIDIATQRRCFPSWNDRFDARGVHGRRLRKL